MTVDTPLTCYVCGVTSDEFVTVDLLGCLRDQEGAAKRFIEKFGREPKAYLFVCGDCRKKNRVYVNDPRINSWAFWLNFVKGKGIEAKGLLTGYSP